MRALPAEATVAIGVGVSSMSFPAGHRHGPRFEPRRRRSHRIYVAAVCRGAKNPRSEFPHQAVADFFKLLDRARLSALRIPTDVDNEGRTDARALSGERDTIVSRGTQRRPCRIGFGRSRPPLLHNRSYLDITKRQRQDVLGGRRHFQSPSFFNDHAITL